MIDTPSPLLYLLGSAIPFVIAGIETAWLVRYTIGLRHLLASTRSIASLVPGEIVIVRGRLRVEGEPSTRSSRCEVGSSSMMRLTPRITETVTLRS